MDAATVFHDDPAAQAVAFQEAGCEWLHVVDLDGALAGEAVNGDAIGAIVDAVTIPVQLGGGVRSMAAIERWLDAGIARLVLGTAAVKEPTLVRDACRHFPGRIAVGIDARAGRVAVRGWTETVGTDARTLAQRFEDAGAAAIVYTDIERDGEMVGVNVPATVALAEALTTPVIASGGVRGVEDIAQLKRHEDVGVAGVICGRALYEGRLDLAAALAAAR
jgi:phosphoribosylformimino-5-aminoimidazole carboxamide ribotide isomerase